MNNLKVLQVKIKIEILTESKNAVKFGKHAKNATLFSVLFNELYDIPEQNLMIFKKLNAIKIYPRQEHFI